ncbi:hypothetical protein ACJX0J_034251 [Zea mays]
MFLLHFISPFPSSTSIDFLERWLLYSLHIFLSFSCLISLCVVEGRSFHEYPKLFCNPYCYLKTYIFEINDELTTIAKFHICLVNIWSVMFTDLDDEPDGENPCGVKKDLEAMKNLWHGMDSHTK